MLTQTKATLAATAVIAIGIVATLLLMSRDDDPAARATVDARGDSALVRDDSRILGEQGSSDVVVVEFLDFECEACGAFYPLVEQLRQDYAGEVTFVARYFPLPGHANGEPAARAVESAARQGMFEQMYAKMFETQGEWGEKQESQAPLFRGYAEELGLDMDQYDADVVSEEVLDRVQRDVADGQSLGVQGTPTFYVDGKLLEPESAGDFYTAIDEALGK